ncbi:MAG: hypothetical protein ACOCX1_03880 [Fimbriimonadaceae bacterium]
MRLALLLLLACIWALPGCGETEPESPEVADISEEEWRVEEK